MNKEQRIKYLSLLLTDAQQCRSIYMESIGDDEASLAVAEELEPWLYGKKCIVEPLRRCLDGEPSDSDVVNFSSIARRSMQLKVRGIVSGRHDPELEEIFR